MSIDVLARETISWFTTFSSISYFGANNGIDDLSLIKQTNIKIYQLKVPLTNLDDDSKSHWPIYRTTDN